MSHHGTILPNDVHNEALVSHVHPPDWTNPTPPAKPYDMVVVGAGTAGLITAIASAGFGKKVALIERHLMGGDCLNVGCVPSKALLHSAHLAAEARSGAEAGVSTEGAVTVDFPKVMERMRAIRAGIAPHDSAARYTEQGVDVYLGEARFTAKDAVEVKGTTLRFKKACIATGGRATLPPIPGIEDVEVLTNESLFSLTELPKRLGVVGGGAIGVEMAQAFARFGSEVTLVERGARILGIEEPDCAAIVQEALVRDGVTLKLESGDLALSRTATGTIRMTGTASDGAYDLEVDQLLVAAGRRPNTDNLGLEVAGVAYDAKGVKVDERLRTSNNRIFAAGDVASRFQFTHAADAMARIVVRCALLPLLPFKPKVSNLVIPWCTYSSPEIARVGKSRRELDDAGMTYRTVEIDLADNDRAKLEGTKEGKLVVHVKPSGKILGATLVSPHAGESIGELTLAMTRGIKLQKLAAVIHPYPTQADIIKRAADTWFKRWLLGWRDRILFWR